MSVDLEALARNKRARELAEELRQYADLLIADHPAPSFSLKRFWEIVAEHASSRIGMRLVPKDSGVEMTDEELSAFERTRVPFGRHAGEVVRDVDPSYWMALVHDNFSRKLVRYVATRWHKGLSENLDV